MSKSIAIIGASRDRRKFGNKAVRAYLEAGYEVFPIHPSESEIEGLAVRDSIRSLPKPVDRISVYLPPALTLGLLDELHGSGVSDIWLNPGAADDEVFRRATEIGLELVDGCSIVDIGMTPSQFQ